MKNIFWFFLLFFLLFPLISCDILLPVDYDKAGRDLMAIMSQNDSITVSDFRNSLIGGMSSRDFFIMMKSDNSIEEFNLFLSMDMVQNMIKNMDVDLKNLQRALKR